MSRFFPRASCVLFGSLFSSYAVYHKMTSYAVSVKKETEAAEKIKREALLKRKEKWFDWAYQASSVSPQLPDITKLTLDELAGRLNDWQESNLSAEALYEQTSSAQFKPVCAKDYDDCVIAFMQLQAFRRKYEAQLQSSETHCCGCQ